jgi:YD repeat-containing protein
MHVRLYFAIVLVLSIPFTRYAFAQQSSLTGAAMSDRDKAGLRGAVKTMIDEQAFVRTDGQQRLLTAVTEYTTDGRILRKRMENPDGSQWQTTYTYDSEGRLLKVSSGEAGSAPASETVYDGTKRLLGVRSGDKNQVRYQYDDTGHKSMIESYDSNPLPPNAGYVPNWEGSELGFAPYPGGTLITSYNEQDVATGAQLYDSQGKLVGHIVRQFDEKGHIISEQQVVDAPESMVPDELRSGLNAQQAKSLGAFMAGAINNRSITYSYDAQGRMTEVHKTGGVFGEERTVTTYNEHGDKASESTTAITNPDTGREYNLTESGTMIPVGNATPAEPSANYEVRYSYEYDGRSNWIEQTSVVRSNPEVPSGPSESHKRKLTYY